MAEHEMALELYYDGQWNEAPVYARDGCVIMRGTNDIGNDTEPAGGTSTIDNRTGDYSPRSLVSSLHGKIGQNTKARHVIDGEVVLTGEMASWRPERDVGGDAWTKAEVAGVLRRIGRGKDVFQSPLRRAYNFEPPDRYWPLDDPRDTTTADGTSPLVLISGEVGFSSDGGVSGATNSLDASAGGHMRTEFDGTGFSAAGWQVEFSGRYRTPVVGSPSIIVSITAAGVTGTNVLNITLNAALWDGASHHASFWVYQDGADIKVDSYRDGIFAETQTVSVGGTLGVPVAMEVNRGGVTGDGIPTISSVVLYNTFRDPVGRGPAAYGWRGETAGNRFVRVCEEQGITPTITADPWDTVPMWVQPLDTFLGILDEIARTDDASIFETRDSVGLTMRPGASRLNQTPALTFSYVGEVRPRLTPEYGDRGIRNDVTATGPVGSDQRVEQATGPHNVQPPEDDPQGVGRYATRIDVNPSTVEGLRDAAGWRVSIGCFDGTWYAEVTVDLDAAPHLTATVAAVDIGDVLELTDTPEDESLESFRGLIVGIRNNTQTHRRLVTFYCIPAEPYQVGVLAETVGDTDPFVGHLETDGASTTAAVAAGATLFNVATETGPLWTTDADDFPQDIIVGGQRVSISGVASALRATFGVVASNGWPALEGGQSWVVGAGLASTFSGTGSVGRIAVSTLNSEHHIAVDLAYATVQRVRVSLLLAVTPTGAAINWGLVLRRADSANLFWIDVQVGTTGTLTLRAISKISGANTQLATAVSATVHSTSVSRTLVAEIDGNHIIRAKVYPSNGTEPGWELVYDASAVTDLTSGQTVGCIARLATGNTNVTPVNFDFDDFAVLNPQVFTVDTTDHQVVYPIPAGADVTVQQPIILAL